MKVDTGAGAHGAHGGHGGHEASMHAAFRGHERCLELLIRHGAHVDSEEIPHPLVFLRVLSMT